MIVPDINLVLYAEIASYPEHTAARRWWEGALRGADEVGLPLPTIFGFVRIGTNARVFDPPLAIDDALERVNAWLEQPNARVLLPGPRHLEIAFRALQKLGTAANLTTDAQLAAFAIENNATLYSNDTDFGRFDGLRWENPLKR